MAAVGLLLPVLLSGAWAGQPPPIEIVIDNAAPTDCDWALGGTIWYGEAISYADAASYNFSLLGPDGARVPEDRYDFWVNQNERVSHNGSALFRGRFNIWMGDDNGTTPLQFGAYTIIANASDGATVWTMTQPFTWSHYEDVTPPTPSIEALDTFGHPRSLANNSTTWFNRPMWMRANGVDDCDPLPLITLTIDGVRGEPSANARHYDLGSPPALHELTVDVEDFTGHAAPALTVHVGFDTAPPSADITSLRDGFLYTPQGVFGPLPLLHPTIIGRTPLAATATDDLSGVARYEWLADGVLVSTSASDSVSLPPGTHDIRLTVWDRAGNSVLRERFVDVLLDDNALP